MTASALSSTLEIKNVTTISRLLRDISSENKQRELICALRNNGELCDASDIDKLEEGIEVTRLGRRAYKTQKSIETLIFGGEAQPTAPYMEDGSPLGEFINGLSDKEPLQIVCLNCVENDILPLIEPLFKNPHRVIEMNHYVCINEDTRNPAMVVNAARKLLFDKRYHLYLSSIRDNGTDAYFLPRAC